MNPSKTTQRQDNEKTKVLLYLPDGTPIYNNKKPSKIGFLERRQFLRRSLSVMGMGILASLPTAFLASYIHDYTDKKGLLEKLQFQFWHHFHSANWEEAITIAKEIEAINRREPEKLALWLNNQACTSVQKGDFDIAECILREIYYNCDNISVIQKLIIAGNLSWVWYHIPMLQRETYLLKQDLIKACKKQVHIELEMPGWIQLWSRRLDPFPKKVVPPFAILGRIYAYEGKLKAAYETLCEEISSEGSIALGARILVAFAGPSIGEEKRSIKLLDEIDLRAMPTWRGDHYAAERDFLLWAIEGKRIKRKEPEADLFFDQAEGKLSKYYSYCAVANVKNFLFSGDKQIVRIKKEYSQRITNAYLQKDKDFKTIKWLTHYV